MPNEVSGLPVYSSKSDPWQNYKILNRVKVTESRVRQSNWCNMVRKRWLAKARTKNESRQQTQTWEKKIKEYYKVKTRVVIVNKLTKAIFKKLLIVCTNIEHYRQYLADMVINKTIHREKNRKWMCSNNQLQLNNENHQALFSCNHWYILLLNFCGQ